MLIYEQLLQGLRQAFAFAISEIFLIVLTVILIAPVVHIFIKEIPLRKQNALDVSLGDK